MKAKWALAVGLMALGHSLGASAQAQAPTLRPDQVTFRALYKKLVETDTSITTGSCTALADTVAGHLKEAGYTSDQITMFSVPDHPKEGGLVVILPGTSKTLKPMLLLGHIDVVVAKREDWTRNPYEFIEENGYFYGRGTSDMKAMDAIWIDAMMRFKKEGYKPKRTIKLALTCGEETSWAFNGAEWLTKNKPDLIAAEFALNEGGGGRAGPDGKPVVMNLHVGEKSVENYRIEATNPGGHSSAPIKDNAIYELADALVKIRDYEFPLKMSDTTKAYFAKAGAARHDEMGAAMIAISKNPNDKAAEAILNQDKSMHSTLRTTCVATMLDGGHANNALPQRAGVNVNCRVFPGGNPRRARKGDRRSAHDREAREAARPGRDAAAARSEDRRPGREAGRQILSRCAVDPGHVDRRHRRRLPRGDRHPLLWPAGHLWRCRRQRYARPQRARACRLGLYRPRSAAGIDQGLRRPEVTICSLSPLRERAFSRRRYRRRSPETALPPRAHR
jgi:acetylornithine deacetylase/succinyl-diaminopimelate desuccinylase-like protein